MNYAFALILLSSPAEVPGTYFTWLRPTLVEMALSQELMDQREVGHFLFRDEDFAVDLSLLRRRYEDLHDAPLLCDAERFPDRAAINEMLSFNRAYRDHLAQVWEPDRWEVVDAMREVDRLYTLWDNVRDARCGYYYVTVRRGALKTVRELIGEGAYRRGELPLHVPLWQFRSIE